MKTSTLSRFLLPLLACLAAPAWAEVDTSTLSQRIEQAAYRNDVQDLETVRAALESATAQPQPDKYLYYYLAYVDYNLAGQYADADTGKAGQLLDSAEEALNTALKSAPDFAEAEGLLGACYGFEIGLHPIKGMFLGPKASEHTERAMRLAPQDPRVLFFKASADFNTPSAFGGDKKRAIQGYHDAISAFDSYKPSDAAAPSWGKALTYEQLGVAEQDVGQADAARADYGKALALVPDYKHAQRHLTELAPAAATAAPHSTL